MKKTLLLVIWLLLYCSNGALAWEIHGNGVDELLLGKRLPPRLVQSDKERIDKLIADGVPFKGFNFKEPPLMVSLEHNKVSIIVIDSPDIRTKEKIGVGSTLEQIKAVYKNVRVDPVPSTFGNDEAVAIIHDLPNVYFYFKDLKTAKAGGQATKIMIFRQ